MVKVFPPTFLFKINEITAAITGTNTVDAKIGRLMLTPSFY